MQCLQCAVVEQCHEGSPLGLVPQIKLSFEQWSIPCCLINSSNKQPPQLIGHGTPTLGIIRSHQLIRPRDSLTHGVGFCCKDNKPFCTSQLFVEHMKTDFRRHTWLIQMIMILLRYRRAASFVHSKAKLSFRSAKTPTLVASVSSYGVAYLSRRRGSSWTGIWNFQHSHSIEDISLFSSREGNDLSNADISQRLADLKQEIEVLNGKRPLNLNSSKEVSLAIYGYIRQVNKQALQESSASLPPGEQKQFIAKVLEYKQLQYLQRQQNKSGTNLAPPRQSEVRRNCSRESNWEKEQDVEEDSPHSREVRQLFNDEDCEMSKYWEQPLLELARPSAQALVKQLKSTICPMGFDPNASPYGSSGTKKNPGEFIKFCQREKKKHPGCIVLTRCGDFYETYGSDAIMLVEHVGLNPMAGKAKAGCPKQNIQSTLDRLTSAGFSTAVFEEAGFVGRKVKARYLSQIISPASPTYLYDLTMKDGENEGSQHSARPFVGILHMASGYTLVEVRLDDQTVRVLERLTTQAVACHLAAHPPADPVWYVPRLDEHKLGRSNTPSFLPHRQNNDGGGRELRIENINPNLLPTLPGKTEPERAHDFILSKVLEKEEFHGGTESRKLEATDFTTVQKPLTGNVTNALQLETATQLGLLHDKAIPSLLLCVLPANAPTPTKEMTHRWLLRPPPTDVAQAMADLVEFAKRKTDSFPPISVPSIGRLLTLVRTGQARASVYGEIWNALTTTSALVPLLEDEVAGSLMRILEYETGLPGVDAEVLRQNCDKTAREIQSVISADTLHSTDSDSISVLNALPHSFIINNENSWRRRVHRSVIPEIYEKVERAAKQLNDAVLADFWVLDDESKLSTAGTTPVVQLIHDNGLGLRKIPGRAENKKHYKSRPYQKGKEYYTTERAERSEKEYVNCCADAFLEVQSQLQKLGRTLNDKEHMAVIVQAVHTNLIISIVLHHARKAQELGWSRATVNDMGQESAPSEYRAHLNGVWPYWMTKQDAVLNTIRMEGMWVLTAPNMSGKSTLMRSTAAAALLSVCGFSAPVGPGAQLDRFDHLFVRGASADVPSEGKSAFGAEMVDVASMLSCCGSRSLVFVDELGRGTSPSDGTRLAGAILEAMASARMTGIFATHLHGLLDLPLNCEERISRKRMTIRDDNDEKRSIANDCWTYELEDGVCRDSMALVTAAQFGVPAHVLERAEDFSDHLPDGRAVAHSASIEVEQVGTQDYEQEMTEPNSGGDRIISIAERLTGQKVPVSIAPNYIPPPSLVGKSCLYILEIPREDQGPIYYIGETDDFNKRLQNHREKIHKRVRSHVFVASHKTEAREWETRLIIASAKANIPLSSTRDGLRSLPSRPIP